MIRPGQKIPGCTQYKTPVLMHHDPTELTVAQTRELKEMKAKLNE
jgi:hypothetical protein